MKAKILILDDDREIHELIAHKLMGSEFILTFVFTAEEAVKELRQAKYDCLMIDIILEDNRSSDRVMEFLRHSENKYNIDMPLLVMSAYMNDEYARSICVKEPRILNTLKKPFARDLSLEVLLEDTILASTFLREDNQIPA